MELMVAGVGCVLNGAVWGSCIVLAGEAKLLMHSGVVIDILRSSQRLLDIGGRALWGIVEIAENRRKWYPRKQGLWGSLDAVLRC